MASRAALFCHNGLGDGIVALILSNNLHLNGLNVDTYQNTLGALQSWFPHLPILSYPSEDEIETILNLYDWIFVFENQASPFIQRLIQQGKKKKKDRVKVIYIYPSKHIVNEPYYQDAKFNPSLPIAENLFLFCRDILSLSKTTQSNGCTPPPELKHRHHLQRLVLHPTGSRISKNWPRKKYESLALRIQKEGYEIAWALNPTEQLEWNQPGFASLDQLARLLFESGYFLGNDSGPGHLASCLGIPTVTLARRKAYCAFSAPSFTRSLVITPSSWIPNIRGFRFRDRYWHHLISVGTVLRRFNTFVRSEEESRSRSAKGA